MRPAPVKQRERDSRSGQAMPRAQLGKQNRTDAWTTIEVALSARSVKSKFLSFADSFHFVRPGYFPSGFQPFQFEPPHVGGCGLKSFPTFAFTAASILMSGGLGRLKPSPGIFLVASMPSLLPLAISLVAWSSTSDGPLVKRLSRCGSVLAQRGARASRPQVSASRRNHFVVRGFGWRDANRCDRDGRDPLRWCCERPRRRPPR